MKLETGRTPMTRRQIIDEYFIENRTKVLDVAAFLDRLDRSADQGAERDFRLDAFCESLKVLSGEEKGRIKRIQMILSDPSSEPKDQLDRKSAHGAYDNKSEEVAQ